ncbi:hypothetical protein C4585_02785 [Candidatus Parcubacteria bacterium]|nr:MAG: hypothetical protein C4585_02785 [Candidatus Parcubacteria bacterium]
MRETAGTARILYIALRERAKLSKSSQRLRFISLILGSHDYVEKREETSGAVSTLFDSESLNGASGWTEILGLILVASEEAKVGTNTAISPSR